jgi:hypothetical protein
MVAVDGEEPVEAAKWVPVVVVGLVGVVSVDVTDVAL